MTLSHQQLLPELMGGQGRWPHWHWLPGDRGGSEGASLDGSGRRQVWRLVYKQDCSFQAPLGRVRQACSPERDDLVSCFPSYKRRTRQWEVKKQVVRQETSCNIWAPEETLANQLRQIRPLRFPGPVRMTYLKSCFYSQALHPRLLTSPGFLRAVAWTASGIGHLVSSP